jgi:hypothetical protein
MAVSVRERGYELSARARALMARFVTAHDDPTVSVEQFNSLCAAMEPEVAALTERDRQQLALVLAEIALRAITGDPQLSLDVVVS